MNTIRLNTIGEVFARKSEGGGDTPSGSTWRYFDVTNFPDKSQLGYMFKPFLIKRTDAITLAYGEDMSDVIGVAVDGEAKLVIYGQQLTWTSAMEAEGMTPEALESMNVSEITEEEFYTL